MRGPWSGAGAGDGAGPERRGATGHVTLAKLRVSAPYFVGGSTNELSYPVKFGPMASTLR